MNMSNPEDPFDKTIWDPVDPEQAIEDPFHGSEALISLLSIPPYRNEDGTFYVFGGSMLPCRTCDFDGEGRPFIELKAGMDPAFMRQLEERRKWIKAFHSGELPPSEEMDLPEFQFNAAPYIRMQPSGNSPEITTDSSLTKSNTTAEELHKKLGEAASAFQDRRAEPIKIDPSYKLRPLTPKELETYINSVREFGKLLKDNIWIYNPSMEKEPGKNEVTSPLGQLPAELGFTETTELAGVKQRLLGAFASGDPENQIPYLSNLYHAAGREELEKIEGTESERYIRGQIGFIVARANMYYEGGQLGLYRTELKDAFTYADNMRYDDIATQIQSALDSIPQTE
jgi:hypothetical protein